MTSLGNGRSHELLVGGVVAVLLGLAGCTPAMPVSEEAPRPAMVEAPEDSWPRRFTSGDITFSIFQPQYEHWEQGQLDGRAAVAVEDHASPEPRYGVIWFTARTQIDKETRMVALEDLTLSKSDFPTVADGGAAYFAALRQLLSAPPLTIALDRLQAQLDVEQVENPGRIVPVNNDPPRIIVSEAPALLVRIDGQPELRSVAPTSFLRVINTRVLLLLDQSVGQYYLWLMDRWLAAPKLAGPWAVQADAPDSLEVAKQMAVESGGQVDLLDNPAPELGPLLQEGAVPDIYVSTTPAELVVIRGQPALAPVAATAILEVTNTDDDLFLYTPDQDYYVLLSGRWFRAKSLQGPWEFVTGDRLPGDFANIPENHPKGAVLASVSGTPQARQAVIANDIPQTAVISRSEAKLSFEYDGSPRLKPIEGTPLQYVVNASVPVIRVDASTYYALQNGVWFVNTSPSGVWTVATSVPPLIYSIPASSPLHYVTYAYVYGSTPDVVYTGYTPGYLGVVVAPGPLVVYGTGYDYPDWTGALWYPAPATWGWSPFDLGVGVDVFTDFEFGFAVGPYWGWHGAWGWHGGCCWGWHHGLSHVNIYHRWGPRAHLTRDTFAGHVRSIRPERAGGIDAYAGRDGHVYRREGGQWQEHNHAGGWEGVRGPTGEHERWHQARQLGEQRLGSFNRGLATHGFGGGIHGGGLHAGGGFHGGGFGGGHGGR